MRRLDRERLGYSLAGEILAGGWTAKEMRVRLVRAGEMHSLGLKGLARGIVKAFPARPEFYELVKFLHAHRGLLRALKRGTKTVARAGRMEERPEPLKGIVLPALPTEAAVAEWLGAPLGRLAWFADVTGRNRKQADPLWTYRYRWVAKREGLPRLLEIPLGGLKSIQRKVLADMLAAVPVHGSAHGFTAGRSIATNAAMHCGTAVVLRFDLADFFASVTAARVFRIFRTLGYSVPVARVLTGLCTTSVPAEVWEGRPGARLGADFEAGQRLMTRHLPQGAPTSPALANLATGRLDRRLAGLAASMAATYTRYADDLAFSGGPALARGRIRLEVLVGAIAIEEGFVLNHRKTRLMRAGVRQLVAGVVVNVRPNVRREAFDALKATLTNCVRHGPETQNREGVRDFRGQLAGRIAAVAAVHPQRGEKLWGIFRRIQWEM